MESLIVFVKVRKNAYYAAKGYRILIQNGLQGPAYSEKDIESASRFAWVEVSK
jgi:hypothetical protein